MSNYSYKSLGKVSVEGVVDAMKRGVDYLELFGQRVKLTSLRMQTYTLGTKCKHCPREAHFFSVERQINDNKQGYHLNLYHQAENGQLIMMTSDHIVPKSLGGSDTELSNRQCLCTICNSRKGNRMESDLITSEAEHAYLAVQSKLKKLIKTSERLKDIPTSSSRKRDNRFAYSKFIYQLTHLKTFPDHENFIEHIDL
jgi:hypothetical protein